MKAKWRSGSGTKVIPRAAILLALAASGCGSDRVVASGAPPVSVSTPSIASTPPEWENEGSRLRATKQGSTKTSSPYGVAENAGDYAFRSDSVDVVGPGAYKLTAPIPPGIKLKGFAVSVPENVGFRYHFERQNITDASVQITMVVEKEDFATAYKSFYVWIY